ncbi:hypothetical protein [Sneathiella aquimaris]|uniref:hypothetical protein n=1 Tax=Sneathiella aquimaris TaxID=2599305 RepID=UPI00146D3CC2|nr:hypothetical protein [Sneathiella aquimaris]
MTEDTSDVDDAMPEAPDLSSLFEDHQAKLEAAQKASTNAFLVFQSRDAEVQALSATYEEEVMKVLMIAKAATTPQLAAAAVPVVLAAANKAFAQASVTELSATSAIEAAFQSLKT